MVFQLPKRINRRHDTDVLRVQKAASPTGFPQKLLPRNAGSSKPQLLFKNKGNICVLGYVYINDYVMCVWVGCFGPAPALSHAPDMAGMLPEHTFPFRCWTGASSCSPGWLQSVNQNMADGDSKEDPFTGTS